MGVCALTSPSHIPYCRSSLGSRLAPRASSCPLSASTSSIKAFFSCIQVRLSFFHAALSSSILCCNALLLLTNASNESLSTLHRSHNCSS